MKIIKSIKILSLICFLTIGVWAQTGATISGTIIDEGEKITNQQIELIAEDGMIETTNSDSKGEFVFQNLRAGKYIVKAQIRAQYIEKEVTITNLESININLEFVSSTDLNGKVTFRETVTVSADSRQTLEEVSKTVNVIDAQELRDRADFSLVESLRTIPGFRVQQLGGFGRVATIKTRGLRNQDTAVLIDGIRFRDATAITGDASPFLSDFTLTSVNKIEVLRGSGSSLYGTNAIGGTIDFQTPKPQNGWHGQIGGAFGGLSLGRFRGNTSYGTDKFGFNVGVSRTAYTKGIDDDDDANNTNFQTRIEYNPFTKTNISARFFLSDAFVKLNSSPDTFGVLPASNAAILDAKQGVNFAFDVNDPDNNQKSKFFNGQAVLTQIINSKLVFQGYYSGLTTSRENDNGILGAGFQSESTSVFDGAIQTANGHFNYTPNKYNQITLGYEYEHERYENEGFTPTGAGDFFAVAKQSSNTLYAQDLVSLLDGNLQFAGGFRAQFFDLKTPNFSVNNAPYTNVTLETPPNAYTFDGSASYFFSKTGTKIRAHVGNGYRIPSLYERFGTFYSSFSGGFTALGDFALKPEKSIAYDFGAEQNLFDNKARLTATYFYTKLIDTIGFGNNEREIPGTPRPFGGYLNTKGGIARGGEFSGKIRATSSTDVFASYTYTNSDQRVPQVAGNPNIATLGIPEHQFTMVFNQRFKRLWVNFDFLATSDYLAPIFSNSSFSTYVYRFDGNRKADLTGGYTFPFRSEKLNLRVYATVENLFDQEYYENGFRTAGQTARIGATFGF